MVARAVAPTKSARFIRGVGWLLVTGGCVVLLYVVYLLWFTGFENERAQNELAESWTKSVETGTPSESVREGGGSANDGSVVDDSSGEDSSDVSDDEGPDGERPETSEPAGAYAAIWFERNGERILHDEELYLVEGVSLDVLQAGPGHYPSSAPPGGEGNFAVAGHRTTYGAPFWSVNELREGDTIHVVDRDRREWVYDYREQRVVQPADTWVVGEDPLESGAPTITLTTCHPRGSAAKRLVVWGELSGALSGEDADQAGGDDERAAT